MNKNNLLTLLIIALSIICFISFFKKEDKVIEVVESVMTDTIYIHKYDTIVIQQPKYITKTVTDTIFVTGEYETISLPVEQSYYAENGKYELWVSGYKTSLDSIKVYNTTEQIVVKNEVIKNIYPQCYRIYAGGGFYAFSRTFIPFASISIATPKKFLIGANLGVYDNKAVYGLNVQYRIFGK